MDPASLTFMVEELEGQRSSGEETRSGEEKSAVSPADLAAEVAAVFGGIAVLLTEGLRRWFPDYLRPLFGTTGAEAAAPPSAGEAVALGMLSGGAAFFAVTGFALSLRALEARRRGALVAADVLLCTPLAVLHVWLFGRFLL